MRIFATLALLPAFLVVAPDMAQACGEGGGREVDFFEVDDSPSTLLAQARQLERQASSQDSEARTADQRAKNLLLAARRMQQRAFQREGIDLADTLQRARQLALDAAEARAHAGRARSRAARFRSDARELRRRAGFADSTVSWRNKRRVSFR